MAASARGHPAGEALCKAPFSKEVVNQDPDPEPAQGAVADAGFPAGLASEGELLGAGLAVATRETQPDHPSRDRAAAESHTGTSPGRAIRRCTNSNADLSK